MVIAEQTLDRVKAFSAFHITPPASGLWVNMELGEDTTKTSDPH